MSIAEKSKLSALKSGERLPDFSRNNDGLKTGHPIVDAIHCMKLQGIIFDPKWLKCELLQSPNSERGKHNLAHALIWAWLIDRYVPIKDVREDGVSFYRKKEGIRGKYYITNYSKLGRRCGLSRSQAKKAVEFFRSKNLVGFQPVVEKREGETSREKNFAIWPVPEMVLAVTGRGRKTIPLGAHLQTGSEICDAMAQINIEGDIIDYNWLRHPLMQNEQGTVDPLLLIVYANLWFLHTPTQDEDEDTHEPIRRRKKFKHDVLYKSYQSWARTFGLADRQLRRATAEFKKRGLCTVEVGVIYNSKGDPSQNKVFIALDIEAAQEVTYGDALKLGQKREVPPKKRDSAPKRSEKETGPKTRGTVSKVRGTVLKTRGVVSEARGTVPETGHIHIESHSDPSELIPHNLDSIHQQQTTTNVESETPDVVDDVDSFESKQAASPTMPQTSTLRVKAQLLEFAKKRHMSLSDEEAETLISTWPAAALEDAELRLALTSDCELYGLDTPVNNDALVRRMVSFHADRVRWALCFWPALRESTDEFQDEINYRHSKTALFLKRWEILNPTSRWLKSQLDTMRTEARRLEDEARIAEKEAFFKSLPKSVKRLFAKDIITALEELYPGRYFDRNSPEFQQMRLKMLGEPDTREWLLGEAEQAQNAPEEAPVQPSELEAEAEEASAPGTLRQMPIPEIIAWIVEDIRGGYASLDTIESYNAGYTREQWKDVEEQVKAQIKAA